jgi:hypothetical protein
MDKFNKGTQKKIFIYFDFQPKMLARKSSFGGGPSSQGQNAGNAGTTPGAVGGGGGMLDHPSMYHSGTTNADYGPSGETNKTFLLHK